MHGLHVFLHVSLPRPGPLRGIAVMPLPHGAVVLATLAGLIDEMPGLKEKTALGDMAWDGLAAA